MVMQDPIALIKESQNVLLTGHLRADGDCLGAQIVLFYVMKALGKEVQIMLPNLPDGRYGFLETQTPWSVFDGELPDYDLLIACDCNEPARLGEMTPEIEKRSAPKMILDHHILEKPDYWDAAFHDVDSPASGVLAIELAEELGLTDLPLAAYEAAFVALMTDTGWLKYSNATHKAWKMAGDLIAKGVDASRIYDFVYQQVEPGRPVGVSEALKNLQYYENGAIAISWVTNDMLEAANATLDDTDEVLDLMRSVGQVEAVAFLCERDAGEIKVSFRSKNYFDMNKVARQLNGGGHARAAGASFSRELGMESAVQETLKVMLAEFVEQKY